ncbi:VIT1/CCC1 transporter family protein [Patescibacteria group bacterium]|nr:VIT1/CCC1 transporter family protein [Patescibacteria group bacterium]
MLKAKYNWLQDFVYGAMDGSVTTFAVVAGVVGANLSVPVILILGFANLFADGFSMAVGKYSSDRAEVQRIRQVTKDEIQSIKKKPKEEKEEIFTILKKFGFKGKELERASKVITSNPETWVHIMLHHEFHLLEENIHPLRGAITTFIAFNVIGIIPLMGYIFKDFIPYSENYIFALTAAATLFALFIVGTVKSRFTDQYWFLGGLETAFIGGTAATIAYVVGFLLKNIA